MDIYTTIALSIAKPNPYAYIFCLEELLKIAQHPLERRLVLVLGYSDAEVDCAIIAI